MARVPHDATGHASLRLRARTGAAQDLVLGGESYRLKVARARAEQKAALRRPVRTKPAKS
jgi:hypothetical protein